MKNLILIPTYNERENIGTIIFDIRKYFSDSQIMVIDDNSPDGTAEVVREMMKTDDRLSLLPRRVKAGLGFAYVDALNKVRGMSDIDNVITMDADGSHDAANLPMMLKKIEQFDLAVGSRYVPGGDIEKWKWYRKLLSSWGNLYSRLILGLQIHDLTSGFVCFQRKILDKLDLTRFDSSGYAYQIEFKYYCVKLGFSVTEVPIVFKERRLGHSKISGSIIWDGLLMPIRLRFKSS